MRTPPLQGDQSPKGVFHLFCRIAWKLRTEAGRVFFGKILGKQKLYPLRARRKLRSLCRQPNFRQKYCRSCKKSNWGNTRAGKSKRESSSHPFFGRQRQRKFVVARYRNKVLHIPQWNLRLSKFFNSRTGDLRFRKRTVRNIRVYCNDFFPRTHPAMMFLSKALEKARQSSNNIKIGISFLTIFFFFFAFFLDHLL